MTTELVAFLDESVKPMRDPATAAVSRTGRHYVLAAAVVLDGDIDELRGSLDRITASIGRQLHYRDLSRQHRVRSLEAVAAIEGWEGYVFETARPFLARNLSEHHVRATLVGNAFEFLSLSRGVARAVIETRSHPTAGFVTLDQKDHDVLHRLRRREEIAGAFEICHATKAEPILQMADLLAGARSDWLCGVDRDPYSVITHKIRSTRTVFDRTQ